jgi:hypothetical protein
MDISFKNSDGVSWQNRGKNFNTGEANKQGNYYIAHKAVTLWTRRCSRISFGFLGALTLL